MTTAATSNAERIVTMPIENPDSKGKSKTFYFRGRIDDLRNGMIDEFKVTSDPLRLIQRKAISFQPELYALALKHEGVEVSGIRYRLLATPRIKLKAKQTPEKYENEVIEWLFAEGESRILEREIVLNPARFETAKEWLWHVTKRILDNRKKSRWMTNENACESFNRQCPFLSLCEGMASNLDVDALIAAGYREREANDMDDEDGIPDNYDTLSYSGASTFANCEMRYYWHYERRLAKQAEDYGEPLNLGKTFHSAREVYATSGLDVALADATERARNIGAVGEDGWRNLDQFTAKVRALLRVSAEVWPIKQADPERAVADELLTICRTKADAVEGTSVESWLDYYTRPAIGKAGARDIERFFAFKSTDPDRHRTAMKYLEACLEKARAECVTNHGPAPSLPTVEV